MKLVQTRSRQTRNQILAAARTLFENHGAEQTSIEQVASMAGVAKASVFAHFLDKTNLVAAVGAESIVKLMAQSRVSQEKSAALPTEQRLFAIFYPWLEAFSGNPDFSRLYLSQSALTQGPFTDEFIANCMALEELCQTIVMPLAAGDPERSILLARGALALFHEVVVYRTAGWLPDLEAAQKQLAGQLAVWVAGSSALGNANSLEFFQNPSKTVSKGLSLA